MSGTGRQSVPNNRLAVLAGGGSLPLHVARAARANGEDPFVIQLGAEADGDFSGFDTDRIGTGDFAALSAIVRRNAIGRVVLSGWVRRRPNWRQVRPTLSTLTAMPRVFSTLLGGGDDRVLRMVIGLIESEGARVVGAHEIAPDLVAEIGTLTAAGPTSDDRRDIEAGARAALELGRLDVGQAAIALGGRVVALEGAEGTDAMIARVAGLKAEGRIAANRRGVLVKLCKPGQDERADLPTIGPATIAAAASAGLSGIALEAGRALVLERAATLREADRYSLFVVGIDAKDTAP